MPLDLGCRLHTACASKRVSCMYLCMHFFCLCAFAFARFRVHISAALCARVHVSSRALSVLSQAIFKPCSPQHALSPLPHFLKCLCGNANPARQVPFVFPSSTSSLWWIKPSSRWNVCHNKSISCRRGNAFERLSVAIRGGLRENTLGCRMCHPGMRQKRLTECQKICSPFLLLYFHTELIHLSRAVCFLWMNILQKMVRVIYFWLFLFCSVSGRQWWWWLPSSLFTM